MPGELLAAGAQGGDAREVEGMEAEAAGEHGDGERGTGNGAAQIWSSSHTAIRP